jgi:hypothetical protein
MPTAAGVFGGAGARATGGHEQKAERAQTHATSDLHFRRSRRRCLAVILLAPQAVGAVGKWESCFRIPTFPRPS